MMFCFVRIKNLKNHKDTFDPELLEDVEIELRQAEETTKHLQQHLNRNDGCLRFGNFKQFERHNEKADFNFHHLDDSNISRQFIRNERAQ